MYVVWMRIGEPARRRSIGNEDILHAARNAIRRVDLGENLTMLIGAARDGALLEIGILDLDGDDPVIIHAQALRRKFERLLGRTV